jgi:hypothetical protein
MFANSLYLFVYFGELVKKLASMLRPGSAGMGQLVVAASKVRLSPS